MATPVRRSATARDDPNGQGEHRGRGPREPRRSVSIRSLPRYLGASPPSPPRARTRSEVFLRTRTARAFPRRKPPPTRLAVSLTPKTSPSSIRRAGELRAVLRTLWSGEYAAFPVRPSSGLLDPAPVSRSRAPRRPRRARRSRASLASRRRPTFRRFNRRRHPFRDRKTRTRFLPERRPRASGAMPSRPRSHRFSLHDTDTRIPTRIFTDDTDDAPPERSRTNFFARGMDVGAFVRGEPAAGRARVHAGSCSSGCVRSSCAATCSPRRRGARRASA